MRCWNVLVFLLLQVCTLEHIMQDGVGQVRAFLFGLDACINKGFLLIFYCRLVKICLKRYFF